jgi:hypothetical protein
MRVPVSVTHPAGGAVAAAAGWPVPEVDGDVAQAATHSAKQVPITIFFDIGNYARPRYPCVQATTSWVAPCAG